MDCEEEMPKKALEALEWMNKNLNWGEFTKEDEDKSFEVVQAIGKALQAMEWLGGTKYKLGDRVRKKGDKGQWHGHVVGFYSASCTKIGYAVESERETGSVQIYPERALELYATPPKEEEHE